MSFAALNSRRGRWIPGPPPIRWGLLVRLVILIFVLVAIRFVVFVLVLVILDFRVILELNVGITA